MREPIQFRVPLCHLGNASAFLHRQIEARVMQSNCLNNLTQQSVVKIPFVLAVDDDKDNLAIAGYVLESLKCRVLTAANGAQALSLARRFQPELILLDIILPNVDGFELIRRLRQDEQTRHAAVIAVTGLVLPQERQRILKAGFNDFLGKPYLLTS